MNRKAQLIFARLAVTAAILYATAATVRFVADPYTLGTDGALYAGAAWLGLGGVAIWFTWRGMLSRGERR